MNNFSEKVEKIKLETQTKRNTIKNAVRAFLIGGIICGFAQGISVVIRHLTDLSEKDNNSLVLIIMIALGSLLTGVGLYDKIGQYAGCGSIIPITGFANSMSSSALESKSEGLLLGIVTNTFKLAGSVIVVGALSGIIVSYVIFLLGV